MVSQTHFAIVLLKINESVACIWHAANDASFDPSRPYCLFTVAAKGCKWNSGDFAMK